MNREPNEGLLALDQEKWKVAATIQITDRWLFLISSTIYAHLHA